MGQQAAGGWATFVCASVGNTLSKWYQGQAPRTMTYDAAGRIVTQLFASATTTFLFDRAGNQTLETESTSAQTGYVYDGENRLTKITYPDGALSTYTYQGYDGLRRTRQEAGGPVTIILWTGADYLGEVNWTHG